MMSLKKKEDREMKGRGKSNLKSLDYRAYHRDKKTAIKSEKHIGMP